VHNLARLRKKYWCDDVGSGVPGADEEVGMVGDARWTGLSVGMIDVCTALWSHIRFHGSKEILDREYVLLTTRTESGASDGKRSHRAFAVAVAHRLIL